MSSHRHLLFLAHRVPFPPNKGDKIRSFHEIRHLAARGWKVHLCALADDPADMGHREALKQYCSSVFIEPIDPLWQKIGSLAGPLRGLPLSAPYFYRRRLQGRVDSILRQYPVDAVLCFCSPMAEYVFRSSSTRLSALSRQPRRGGQDSDQDSSRRTASQLPTASARRPRLVMDLVDVDSDKWAQYGKRAKWPMNWVYRIEAALLARYEKKVAQAFDVTVLVSAAEAEVFRRRSGIAGKIQGVGNGVDLEYFHPVSPDALSEDLGRSGSAENDRSLVPKPPSRQAAQRGEHDARGARLVFCGAMDYAPNVDAVVWFSNHVLPLLRSAVGEVTFTVVGSKPTAEVLALADLPGVVVTGRVEDVRPYVWEADVSVTPIRVARGIQNKVLEAMAMGKPVVSTQEAFEGIEAEAGADLLVVEADPHRFASAVAGLLADGEKAGAVGRSARRAVEQRYAWHVQLNALEELMLGSRIGGECGSCDAVRDD